MNVTGNTTTNKRALSYRKNNHYISWTRVQRKELDIVKREAEKNDRLQRINLLYRKRVSYFVLVYNINSISILKKAIYDLIDGNINLELQRTSKRLSNRE